MFKGKMLVSGIILTIAALGQIIAVIVFYDPQANTARINIGWFVMMLSAVFGWLPILTFRQKGQVEGRSYMHTTVVVDSGIYSIVRHPQYLAGILMAIAFSLITLHWLVALLGLVVIVNCYSTTFDEEVRCIEKFGDEYRQYMQRVPRINFLAGIARLVRSRLQ
ncbi:MAG: isoprenylcysteine carboxylmethyltransferase family protein [Anaerolineales bacterium]|jgi:protein-S-isoprenylcysteine O-methyltransferase Ste14